MSSIPTHNLYLCQQCDIEWVGSPGITTCMCCLGRMIDVTAELHRLAETFDPVKWLVTSVSVIARHFDADYVVEPWLGWGQGTPLHGRQSCAHLWGGT